MKNKKLRKYFDSTNQKPTPWGVKHDIAPCTLTRILRGDIITAATALKISLATADNMGVPQVSVLDLLYPE